MSKQFKETKNNEMINSLGIEFKYSKKALILETRGSIDNIDDYIFVILEKFKKETQNGQINKIINITTEDFKNIKQHIANEYNITIDFKNVNETKLVGSYIPIPEVTNDKLNIIKINITAHCKYKFAITSLNAIIAHEFLHAYENLKRIINKKKNLNDTAIEKHYTDNNVNRLSKNEIIKTLATIYYYCTSFERNAYVAQINAEMKNKKNQIYDVNTAFQILQNTNTYQKYINLGEKLIQIINNKQQYQNDINEWYNLTFNNNLTSNKILKKIYNLYNKTWKKIRKTTASYIKMLYENNNNVMFYDDF